MMKTNLLKQTVIIVDPIFRGSRLHYTALAANAVSKNNHHPIVITRYGAETSHYHELFKDISHSLIMVFRLPEDFWYGKICKAQVHDLVRLIAIYTRDTNVAFIYIPGWNEWFPLLAINFLLHWVKCKDARILAVDYSPGYFIKMKYPIQKKLRYWIKRWIMIGLIRRIKAFHLLMLDERIEDLKFSRVPKFIRNQVHLLVDPAIAGNMYGYDDNITTTKKCACKKDGRIAIMLVGKQSARKGLIDVIKVLESYPNELLNIHFKLFGELTKDTELLRFRINSLVKKNFSWRDEYLSESELFQAFEDSDYVMMPYSEDFDGSSGVLANALLHGKPVVATDHGLIGYRIRKHQLGLTYKSGDIVALRNLLLSLPLPHQSEYHKMAGNSIKLAKSNSRREHIDTLLQVGLHESLA